VVPKRRQDLASKAKDSRLDPVVMFHLVFLLLTLAESWFCFFFCEKGGLFFSWFGFGGFIMTERVLSYKNCLIPPLVLVLLTTTFSPCHLQQFSRVLMAALDTEGMGIRTDEN